MCFIRVILFFSALIFFPITSLAQAPNTTQTPPQNSLCPRPLNVGWSEYPPFQGFTNTENNSQPTGADAALLEMIGNALGCHFQYHQTPPVRQIQDLKAGTLDLIFSNLPTNKIQDFAIASTPYRTQSFYLFVRKNETQRYDIKKLDDLKGTSFLLAVRRGFYYGSDFEKASTESWFSTNVEENSESLMNIKKLIYGRVDGIILEKPVEISVAKQTLYHQQIELHPFILFSGPENILFNKQNVSPAFINAFNEQMKQLQANGKIQEILTKYNAL